MEEKSEYLLHKITEEINSGKSFDDVFNLIYENLKTIIQYNRIGIAIVKNGSRLIATKARSDGPMILEENFEENMMGSSLEEVIKKGNPRIINDLEDYLKNKPASEPTKKIVSEGMRSSLTLPLLIKGKPVGVIFFSSRNKNSYIEKDSEYLRLIAGHLAISFEKAMFIDELEKTNERLKELNKMKDEFLSIVSHDLRQPLTSILVFSDMFLTKALGEITEKQREGVEIIKSATIHLTGMINDLLDLVKIKAGKVELRMTRGNIVAVIKESISAMRFNAYEKKINIKENLPETEPVINADWMKIFQVMNNLIGNAIKFTHDGGSVTISLKYNLNNAEVSVADTGQGIAKEDIPHIFDKFKQGKTMSTRGEKGSGLGLTIVKNLIELHHGKIWVESEVGKGTTFYFSIPINMDEIIAYGLNLPKEEQA